MNEIHVNVNELTSEIAKHDLSFTALVFIFPGINIE